MRWSERFVVVAALVLLLGIVLSPFRATAATVPTFIVYDALVANTPKVRVEAEPSPGAEWVRAPVYVYDAVDVGHDGAANPQIVGRAGAVHAYDGAIEMPDRRRELAEGAIYGAPAPTAAAEGAGAAARTFTSSDPLVADLANQIEAAYPGHVVGVNVPMYNGAGQLATDADILLQNAVIQVKSGSGAGLTSQLLRTQAVTDLPVIGYGPNLGGSLVQGIQAGGGLVTRDPGVLISVVAP